MFDGASGWERRTLRLSTTDGRASGDAERYRACSANACIDGDLPPPEPSAMTRSYWPRASWQRSTSSSRSDLRWGGMGRRAA